MNPVALITGSSRGIGRGIAIELARLGQHDLVIHYASNEAAARDCQETCRRISEGKCSVELVGGDISDRSARRAIIDFMQTHFGRVDLLVNNAGVAPQVRADLLEADEGSFDRIFGTNLKAPYFLSQAIAKMMIGSVPHSGVPRAIVNITSISAFTVSPNRGDYCMAKAALSMMTQLFAVRLAEHGISVFEVQPGVIETDMTRPVKEKYDRLFSEGLAPINRWGTPADVGKCVAAIAAGSFPYSTGQAFRVDGGFHIRTL